MIPRNSARNAAIALMEHHGARQSAALNCELGRTADARADEAEADALLKEARRHLKQHAIDNISLELDQLALTAWNAFKEVHWSIMKNSRPVAKFLAKLGDTRLKSFQELRDAPPEQRYAHTIEIAKQDLAWRFREAQMRDPTVTKLTDEQIEALVNEYYSRKN